MAKPLPRFLRDYKDLLKWADTCGVTVEIEDGKEEITSLPVALLVEIDGPKDSPYEGGRFKIRCEVGTTFPNKSPSVAFVTKIWHVNVEPSAGSVCLDVLNDRWTPAIRIQKIFEHYIPQLLQYPEATDPFNTMAAAMSAEDLEAYTKAYTLKYATTKENMTSIDLPTVPTGLSSRRVRRRIFGGPVSDLL